jgi:hypothetical protein
MLSRRLSLAVLIVGACASDESPSLEQRCERLRDHVIERKLVDASGVDREKHATALRTALGADFLERCATQMSESQRSCALDARDAESINACSKL